ncbi:MAG: hypothetical protein J5I65_15155 [Aridibacter famidurans]|nr:hypothetical protein [Aridibacter famidurans]
MKNALTLVLLVLVLFPIAANGQPQFAMTPETAKVVSSDIANFVEAMDKFSAGGDKVQTIQELYFDRGSPGLQEFVKRFGLNASELAKAYEKNPEQFAGLKGFLERFEEFEMIFRDDLRSYKKIYPKAMFAPTYFLVGADKGIGQASAVGQLVSVETAYHDPERISTLAVHEVTHFQQAVATGPEKYTALYSQKDNMLGIILREGGADFVTYKLVAEGKRPYSRLQHLERSEVELWDKFQRDLKDQNKKFWLEVSFDDANSGYAYMLGYALGYKIVRSYYDRAEDKARALADILAIADPEEFLKKSGYSPRLTKLEKEFRFGTPAADAPPQVRDYDELIGMSDCKSVSRGADGTWAEPVDMLWTFRYELGGTAVRDETRRADGFYAGSIRQFNPDDDAWYVHYYSTLGKPPARLPAWKGGRKGNEITLLTEQKAPNGTDGFYRIRFYDISEKGFNWLGSWTSRDGSFVFDTWKIECVKREM